MSTNLHQQVQQIAEALRADLEAIRTSAGFDANWHQPGVDCLSERDEQQVGHVLQNCLMQLASFNIQGPENQLPSQVLWNVVGSELRHGALQLRAREKPRGYAGDDILLRQIFEETVCSHPLGRAFDLFFQSLDAPTAVRGRIQIAAGVCQEAMEGVLYDVELDQLPDLPVSVIGAGPAIELELAIRAMQRGDSHHVYLMRPVLFDLDEQALTAAKARIETHCPEIPVQMVRENLFRLARQPQRARALRNSRAIICLGLMDYLNDEDAAGMLELCWRNLDEYGRMLVGNFSPNCRARTYMEWIGNWYLNYRTAGEFHDLAMRAGIPEKHVRIETDPTGVNLLLQAWRS